MKILIHSSLGYSLVNFRGALLRALREQGHEILATAPDHDPDSVKQLEEIGVDFRHVPMARASLSPIADLRTLIAYFRLMRSERPDLLIAYTQKPIIYGGLIARLFPTTRFHVIMSGLGFVFSEAAHKRKLLRKLVSWMYREALRNAGSVFVFNSDDRQEMLGQGIITPTHNVVQVPGSGVDTTHFAYAPLPEGTFTVLLVARLMRDKGIYEFVDAARIVKQTYPQCRFQVLGRAEMHNPTSISQSEIEQWSSEGAVEFLPETRDVRPHLRDASIFVLPSYYREGLPRTILEALSTGRPVVTTDMAGCRDAITHGENGLLVPPKSVERLSDAIKELISDPDRLRRMSVMARISATEKYDVAIVNSQMFESMGLTPYSHCAEGEQGLAAITPEISRQEPLALTRVG